MIKHKKCHRYGPLLVHTTMGDLLRSLEAGPELTSAANLSLSREGLVVASYPSHHVAVFTINGKKLRSELHSDNVQVRADILVYFFSFSKIWIDKNVVICRPCLSPETGST